MAFTPRRLMRGASGAQNKDPYFNYVTMLLHGDGTNGAQNNTFLDSSTNNFTITRNGNTTQGSFSPYGSNWSNYFGGGSNYLDLPSNAAYGMGTGDFTIEAWLYPTAAWAGAGSYNPIFLVNGTGGLYFGQNSAGFGLRQSATANIISYGTSPALNTWTHVAIVRSGTTVTMYYNGTSVATATSSANFTSGTLTIAYDGSYGIPAQYISNLRIVKGTAVYTAAFTPSTTPLAAITNTSLLTCQSNRFIDNSSNAFAITVTGTPSVQRFNPFGTSTAYSTSVIGGSGYFDGTDRLVLPTQPSMTGDFTVELYFYITGKGLGDPTFISNWPVAGTAGNIIVIQMGGTSTTVFAVYVGSATGSGNLAFTASTGVYNQWNHIAVTRSGSSMACFFNGVRVATSTNSNTITLPANTAIGSYTNGDSGGNYFQGYISNLRIVNGTAVYDPSLTTCTVPTTPLTAITNTQLLTSYVNGAIYDNAMMNDLETVGNAQISTSVKKYGTGSMYFDGTGDYLVIPSASSNQMGAGPFTMEMWIYPTTISGTHSLIGKYIGGDVNASEYWVWITSTGRLAFAIDGNGGENYVESGAGAIVVNTWTHVAVIRTISAIAIYINGTQANSAGIASNVLSVNTTPLNIGAYNSGLGTYFGYIDDLRITKGVARYSGGSFTPITKTFSDTGPN